MAGILNLVTAKRILFLCCAVYLFSRYPHPGLLTVTRFFSPPIGAASVEVQLSNQEKLFLHLLPNWCGTYSSPPDLPLHHDKRLAIRVRQGEERKQRLVLAAISHLQFPSTLLCSVTFGTRLCGLQPVGFA